MKKTIDDLTPHRLKMCCIGVWLDKTHGKGWYISISRDGVINGRRNKRPGKRVGERIRAAAIYPFAEGDAVAREDGRFEVDLSPETILRVKTFQSPGETFDEALFRLMSPATKGRRH